MTDVAALAAEFELDGPVTGVQPFGAGLINDTFLVTTVGGEYVVQRINRAVFSDAERVMRNIGVVTRHLGGRYVPELVASAAGSTSVRQGDDVWRAWRRVAGAVATEHPTRARVANAAVLLGHFHHELADLDPTTLDEVIPSFHAPAARLARLRAVIAEDPRGRVAVSAPEIDAALATAELVNIAEEIVARVPRRVAHNDAQLNNVLFRGDEAVCIVDLDTVMPTAWFWDLGDLLRSASSLGAEDDPVAAHNAVAPELHDAIVTSYRAAASAATADERDAINYAGVIVTYEQAVRFLTDWLAGDVYYRVSRPEQNLDRARAQLALLASMRGTVGV